MDRGRHVEHLQQRTNPVNIHGPSDLLCLAAEYIKCPYLFRRVESFPVRDDLFLSIHEKVVPRRESENERRHHSRLLPVLSRDHGKAEWGDALCFKVRTKMFAVL